MRGPNRNLLERNPTEIATPAGGLAPAQPHLSALPASPRVFFRDRLYGLRVQMQPFFSSAARELRKIVSREKTSFAIELLDLQVVAVVPHEIDLAGEIAEEPRVLVLEPQP